MNVPKRISLMIVITSLSLWSATYRVSKTGGGQFTSIQAAVNHAEPGDIIEVIDYSVYEEQVTIDSTKNGLTLCSSNPTLLSKPTIKYLDNKNISPINQQEYQQGIINFDQNGALRLLGASNILIEGIAVDGGGHYTFCHQGIWPPEGSPLFHGNAAITVWLTGKAVIRHCDIKNAHFGINLKDRNQGGIFANANPGDLEPWNVVPLSRYGQIGGHLIEENRIHDNVFGFFNESAWDMGSTIRYNLIYENHYIGDEAAETDDWDGSSHPGGAFEFKDNMLTPLAIYNNTFWHNFNHFSGHWRAGPQHLIFNNIYAEVNKLWRMETSNYGNNVATHAMDKAFTNRMKHCVYDLMKDKPQMRTQNQYFGCQDPGTNQHVSVNKDFQVYQEIRIQDNMNVQKSELVVSCTLSLSTGDTILYATIQDGNIVPGAPVQPFPESAMIGYYPVKFKSTDPTSSDFLVPDWDDTVVQRLILDQGWPEAGITDADGSPADLGAIPKGGIPGDRASIISLTPVLITGQEAKFTFNLKRISGTSYSNPKMKYIKFLNPILPQDTWGGNATPIATSAIQSVNITSGLPLNVGQNTLIAALPPGFNSEYAFYEMFIEGTGSQGKQVISGAGFIPYRKLDYFFKVWVMDLAKTDTLDSVYAGDVVFLFIEAYNKDGSKFTNDIGTAQVNLASGFDLHSQNYPDVISGKNIPGGIPGGYKEMKVMFTKVPDTLDGIEYVHATGLWSSGNQQKAFVGVSDGIKILPGPAAKVLFQDPPSRKFGAAPAIIDPGINYSGYLIVTDRFDNLIDESVSIPLSVLNNNPNGTIVGANPISTNTSGRGDFTIQVEGDEGDIITFIAELNSSVNGMVYDSADVEVGKPHDQLWIFYDDIGNFNPAKKLTGEVGERLKTTVGVTEDGLTINNAINNVKITVKPMDSAPITFYASQTGAEQSEFTLVEGKVDVWVTSMESNDENGPGYGMTVFPSDPSSQIATSDQSTRYKLYFTKNLPRARRAAYYDSDGNGCVDSVTITYADTLKGVSDTVVLYWPEKVDGNKRIITDARAITLSSDKKTMYISIDPPFSLATAGDGIGQTWHDAGTGISEPGTEFDIIDSVAPVLIDSMLYIIGTVISDDTREPDTAHVLFSEDVKSNNHNELFLFLHTESQSTYQVLIESGSFSGNEATFIVDRVVGREFPSRNDSAWINSSANIEDEPGNVQDKEKNRRVPVKTLRHYNLAIKAVTPVKPSEYELSNILSNLEFDNNDLSFKTGVYIRIDPQIESGENEFFTNASVKILDAVGNCVASNNTINDDNGILLIARDEKSDRLHIFWSGQNANKRYVGNGVYILIIEVVDKEGRKITRKISIGVQE